MSAGDRMRPGEEHLTDLFEWLVRTVAIAALLGAVVGCVAGVVLVASDHADSLWLAPAGGFLAAMLVLMFAKAPRPGRFDAAIDARMQDEGWQQR
jgi:Mg/Co/Ni transporter MgtE